MQVVVYLIFFVAHMNISFIIKVKILVLIKLAYTPEIMLNIEPRMVCIFWVHSPISCEHISFLCLFLGPHPITHHSNIGVQIIVMLDSGMSTLREVGGSEITEAIAFSVFDNRWMALCHVSKPGMSFDGLCIRQKIWFIMALAGLQVAITNCYEKLSARAS